MLNVSVLTFFASSDISGINKSITRRADIDKCGVHPRQNIDNTAQVNAAELTAFALDGKIGESTVDTFRYDYLQRFDINADEVYRHFFYCNEVGAGFIR